MIKELNDVVTALAVVSASSITIYNFFLYRKTHSEQRKLELQKLKLEVSKLKKEQGIKEVMDENVLKFKPYETKEENSLFEKIEKTSLGVIFMKFVMLLLYIVGAFFSTMMFAMLNTRDDIFAAIFMGGNSWIISCFRNKNCYTTS